MKIDILLPQLLPQLWLIYFSENKFKPVHKPVFAPPTANSFYSVNNPAKSTLYGIGRKRYPAFAFQLIVENNKDIFRKVFDICSGFGVFFRIKSVD